MSIIAMRSFSSYQQWKRLMPGTSMSYVRKKAGTCSEVDFSDWRIFAAPSSFRSSGLMPMTLRFLS